MRLRRSIIAAALAPTLALATVTPAVAEGAPNGDSTGSSSAVNSSSNKKTEGDQSTGTENTEGSSKWSDLHPVTKVIIGIAAATGISVAFGVLRTIFFNLFHA